jgi:hypothetical protein
MSYFPNTKTSVLYLLCIYLVPIAPPFASRVHADAHSDTFQEAALPRYRLSSDSIDFTMLESFDELSKVVMLHLKNSKDEAKPLRLSFASTDMRIPFSPIIPPYVGLHAKRISLKVWVEDPGCLAGATIVAGREDGPQEKFSFDPSPVQAYKWITFSWSLAMSGEPVSRLNCVELVLESRPRTDAFAYLADLNIQYHGQQEPYDLLTMDMPLLTTGMSTPLETNPVRSLPVRDTLALGCFDILARRLHLPRTITASSSPVMAHRFSAPGFEVLDIWTGLNIPGFKAGYGLHLMPGREAEDFDPAQRPYPLLLPGVDVTIEVPVGEAGDYRVYAFLSGNECVVPSSPAKMLSLKISNISAEQFSFTVDTPGVREKIKMLKNNALACFHTAMISPATDKRTKYCCSANPFS